MWYDFYKGDNFLNVYNMCDVVVGYDKHYSFSLKDIQDGKSIMSIDDFYQIIDHLKNSDISIPKISDIVGVPQSTIYSIYFREEYKELTKDYIFIKRKHGTLKVLNQDMAKNIIKRLSDGEYPCDIARDMKINPNAVYDIRNHKTWKEYTNNIIFPDISAIHRPSKSRKKVYQYDYSGNLLNVYDSVIMAGEMSKVNFKDISSCCRGKLRSAGKYVWRFENDKFDKYNLPSL